MSDSYFDDNKITSYAAKHKVPELVKSAEKAGKLTSISEELTHFSGTPNSPSRMKGMLDWIRNGFSTPQTGVATDGIAKTLSELTVAEKGLVEARTTAPSMILTLEEKIASLKQTLVGHAETLIPQLRQAAEHHMNVALGYEGAQAEAILEARNHFNRTITADPSKYVGEDAVLAERANLAATEEAIKAHYGPLIAGNKKVRLGVQAWEQQIEQHTGVKADEIMAKVKASGKVATVVETAPKAATSEIALATDDAGNVLKTAEGHSISAKAKIAGVVGEKDVGFFNKIKANLNISSLKEEGGVITAAERRLGGKLAVGGGALAGVGAIAVGINGLVSTPTGPDGQPRESNTGDYIKNAGLIVGGGIATSLLVLGKGKAAGHLAV